MAHCIPYLLSDYSISRDDQTLAFFNIPMSCRVFECEDLKYSRTRAEDRHGSAARLRRSRRRVFDFSSRSATPSIYFFKYSSNEHILWHDGNRSQSDQISLFDPTMHISSDKSPFMRSEELHVHFSDPRTQIRLLQFLPSSRKRDDPICLSMSIWPLSKAPSYMAMSYTWGDVNDTEHIIVNEMSVCVRKNCHYVLWQARLHHPTGYIWIDSICINQEDLHEKSVQVAMMFEIYSAAFLVLACVGPHDEESICLFEETASGMKEHDKGRNSFYQLGFADRPYFLRVWIVQELFAAKHNVEILCGPDRLSWASMAWLSGRSKSNVPMSGDLWLNSNDWVTEACSELRTWSLEDVFKDFKDLKCFDPRDRLFGLLSLIEWPTGVDPILPDYTKTIFDLALQLADYLKDDGLEGMLRAFRISHDSEDSRALINSRQHVAMESMAGTCKPKVYIESRYICGYGGGLTLIDRLEADARGHLTTPLLGFLYLDNTELASILATMPDLRESQQPLTHNQKLVGSVCSAAGAGDVIVAISGQRRFFRGHRSSVRGLLALRHSHASHYDIVGQGLVPVAGGGSALIDYRPYDKANQLYAKLEVCLSAEDKVVLIGQDLKDGERGLAVGEREFTARGREAYDLKACFRRVATRPVSDPRCAVKMIWEGSARDMEESHPDWYEEFHAQRLRKPRGY